ncbi:MAG TPA: hydrogenase [Desulfobulbus sp.]|nr:hydrogenase [Desulfobulbus sp.]
MADFIAVHNGRPVAMAAVPLLDFSSFRERLLELCRFGCVVQYFALATEQGLCAVAVIRLEDQLLAGRALLPQQFPSLTRERPRFHMFEREMAEQYGVLPQGHPWLKPLRYHCNWRGVDDVFGNDYNEDIPGRYPWYRVEGDEIHEVAVGPVHAGIIEPGHFRFQCNGETVLHLEIGHGYQHRGVEPLLCRVPEKRRPFIAEAVAGDTGMAGSLSYAQAVEGLAGLEVGTGAQAVRTIAVELERLANHVGDLGALAGDVAFTPPAAFFGRMRGEFLNLLLLLSGNRFGRGLIRPGGIAFPVDVAALAAIAAKVQELRPELVRCVDLLLSAHTVLSRFENCGIVSREAAECLGMVGPAGRASWMAYDARIHFPTERYPDLPAARMERPTGDVLARARVRAGEIMHSLDCVEILAREGQNVAAAENRVPGLAPDSMVVTVNEAWRGELSHCLVTGPGGEIIRYKIKDPSFHNWAGLAMALRDEGISDFPVNNKSFNLSYCGMDL